MAQVGKRLHLHEDVIRDGSAPDGSNQAGASEAIRKGMSF